MPSKCEKFSISVDGESLSCTAFTPARPVTRKGFSYLVLMHGAGVASQQRLFGMATVAANRGYHALTFDLAGHGESSGRLIDQSLRRRYLQAFEVIKTVAPLEAKLALVGFSMSGQTVADLCVPLESRISSIILCAPAVYSKQAHAIPFGAGFTDIIRTDDSWRDSSAFETFRQFSKRAVVVLPGLDDVIPHTISDQICHSLAARSQLAVVNIPEAQHQLGLWFTDHPNDVEGVLDKVGLSLVADP